MRMTFRKYLLHLLFDCKHCFKLHAVTSTIKFWKDTSNFTWYDNRYWVLTLKFWVDDTFLNTWEKNPDIVIAPWIIFKKIDKGTRRHIQITGLHKVHNVFLFRGKRHIFLNYTLLWLLNCNSKINLKIVESKLLWD